MNKIIDYINDNNIGMYKTNESFKNISTMKVGGLIKLLCYPSNINKLISFLNYLIDNNYKWYVIGNCSNIVASDKPFDGVIICLKKLSDKIIFTDYTNKMSVIVHSGVMCSSLQAILKDHFLTGGEAMKTIPGTIGGAVSMNATCYDFKTSDYLVRCLVYKDKEVKWYKRNELKFSYRESILKRSGYVVLGVEMVFMKGDINKINQKEKNIYSERKLTQPLGENTCGSIFKNPKKTYAWKVIDSLNLRGYKINDALISYKHPNFIINRDNAQSKDIFELINLIKHKAKNDLNIKLEEEVVLFNFM